MVIQGYKGRVGVPNYMKKMIRQRYVNRNYDTMLRGAEFSDCDVDHHGLMCCSADMKCIADHDHDVESPKHAGVATNHSSPSSLLTQCSGGSGVRHEQCSASWKWRGIAEDCLWLASAAFILYYGDFRSDFFSLLANDGRVLRTPLHMGLACLMMDVCVVMLYLARIMRTWTIVLQQEQSFENNVWYYIVNAKECMQEVHEVDPSALLQVAVVAIGSTAFILMCIALWPIWSFLTIPMLFTLLMALTVVAPYVYIIIACTKQAAKDMQTDVQVETIIDDNIPISLSIPPLRHVHSTVIDHSRSLASSSSS
ncbi:hypothetical protein GOP47_0027127 [Adiantum capillus-veneris]|nr:hypothetical protein GOP47_0027127 [Adiantum capillus-veneris]